MIKINLLPIRAARKREYVVQQLILFAILILGGIVGIYLFSSSMEDKIEQEKVKIASTKQQIEQYKKAIGQVERYKGLEEQLNRKLEIIESLIKGKTGPVRVLDKLSTIIPKQVWLTSWTDKGGLVSVKGEALKHKYVAEFVSLLKEESEPKASSAVDGAAPEAKPDAKPDAKTDARQRSHFSNIRMVETKAIDDSQLGQSFVEFELSMGVNYGI
ncbi:MAG: PilN domain-containing protein [Deltaproteobacteria bacterium]|nr:PilN domain-containing protein [Deltaproteobacteria bacterium]